ncbi:hypothetical protein, partial [Staphylococcus epidermidis]|uniref:hypothetical protein n=1 Tax=Staphylococcus epidermidis TaxID=1282 RepID=UPI00311EC709
MFLSGFCLETGAFETPTFAVQNEIQDRTLAWIVHPQRSGPDWANGRRQVSLFLTVKCLSYQWLSLKFSFQP